MKTILNERPLAIECWRTAPGFENYQVSMNGEVRSVNFNKTGKFRQIKPSLNSYGYLQLQLCKNGKKINWRINRLVALAFIVNDDPENKTQVNHINEDKTDNRAENLEWCTPQYNVTYGTIRERISKAQLNDPNKSKRVAQYTKDGKLVKIWSSLKQITREMGWNAANISKVCYGKRPSMYGFLWRYVD